MIRSHSSVLMSMNAVEAVLARPVDQHEHRPSSRARALDGGVDLRPVRDVDLARDRLAALVADALRGALGLLDVEVEHRHLGAVAGQPFADRQPDARRATGHDRGGPCKRHVHSCSGSQLRSARRRRVSVTDLGDQRLDRRAGREHRGHAHVEQRLDVGLRHRPADHDLDVADADSRATPRPSCG